MQAKQRIGLVVLALCAGIVVWLAVGQRTPPFVPGDEDHAGFQSADDCLACHASDGPAPRSINHPVGRDCMRCHGIRK